MLDLYPKYIKRMLFYSFVLICTSVVASTSIPRFFTVPGTSALTTSHILDITKDKKGFMWFATMQGLYSYDGYDVRQYAPVGFSPRSYAGAQMVAVDGDGIVWTRLSIGKTCFYDAKHDGLSLSSDSLLENRGIDMKSESMIVDNSGDLWAQNGKELLHYSFSNRKLSTLSCPYEVVKIVKQEKTFFLLTRNGYIYKVSGEKISLHAQLPLRNGEDSKLFADNSGSLWVTQTYSGASVFRVDSSTGKVELLQDITQLMGNDFIRSIVDDGKGRLWFAANSVGLIGMDKVTGKMVLYQKSRQSFSLPCNHIEALYADNDVLWLGTAQKGPVMATLSTSLATRTVCPETERITSVLEDIHGDVWVGFDGMGVRRIKKDGSQILYNTSNSNIPSNTIIGMFLHGGYVWMYSYGGGLFYFDGNKFVKNEIVASYPELSQCQTCLIDDHRNLWVSTFSKGVYRISLDLKNSGFIEKIQHLRTDNITAMTYSAKDRQIYIGTAIGAYAVDASGKVKPIADGTHVLCMLADKWGRLWMGTNGGLDCYDSQGKLVRTITFNNGLASDHVKALALNGAGNLWVGCMGGLSRIVFSKRGDVVSVKTFVHNDAMNTYDFYRNAISFCKNGDIIYANDDDFIRMNIRGLNDKTRDYAVSFTSYSVEGIYKSTLIDAKNLNISYGERTFSINLTTFTYNPDRTISYRYRMNSHQAWTIIEGNTISFNELTPGNYDVEVQAKDASGDYGKSSILHISVAEPWWWSLWAKILYLIILASALAIYLIYIQRSYSKKMINQRKELEEKGRQDVEDARMQILTNVIDEGLLQKVNENVMAHIDNVDYSVMDLAKDTGISHSGLYKKLMAITKKSPLEYMHLIRLKRGKEILDGGETSISQVAYQVGLSPKQFSKYFKQVYGMLPSEYITIAKTQE